MHKQSKIAKNLIKSFSGIRKCRFFGIDNPDSEFQRGFPKGIVPESEKVWVTFNEKIYFPSFMDVTYQVDGNLFLKEYFKGFSLLQNTQTNRAEIEKFVKKCQLIFEYFEVDFSFETLGKLIIEKRKINSLNEVLELKPQMVFNCLGFFSKYIFEDKNLISVKGSMIYYNNTNKVVDYIHVRQDYDDDLLILPSRDNVAIGVTKSYKPINPKEDMIIMKNLYNKAMRFFKPML